MAQEYIHEFEDTCASFKENGSCIHSDCNNTIGQN